MNNLSQLDFSVISSNITKNGDYHTKLQHKGSVKAGDSFGETTKEMQVTYYRFLDNQVPVGTVGKIDFTQFDIRLKPWEMEDGSIAQLKYLEPKTN